MSSFGCKLRCSGCREAVAAAVIAARRDRNKLENLHWEFARLEVEIHRIIKRPAALSAADNTAPLATTLVALLALHASWVQQRAGSSCLPPCALLGRRQRLVVEYQLSPWRSTSSSAAGVSQRPRPIGVAISHHRLCTPRGLAAHRGQKHSGLDPANAFASSAPQGQQAFTRTSSTTAIHFQGGFGSCSAVLPPRTAPWRSVGSRSGPWLIAPSRPGARPQPGRCSALRLFQRRQHRFDA